MKTRDYFIEALQAEQYKYLDWVIDCFSVTDYPSYKTLPDEQKTPYKLVRDAEGSKDLYFIDEQSDTGITKLEEYQYNEPLMSFKTKISLNPNDLPNVKQAIDTTYGNVFYNAYVLCYAFGDKIPFTTGRIEGKTIEKQIVPRLRAYDPNVDPTTRDKQFIYVDELLKHNDAVSALEGLSMIAVPSVSVNTMRPTKGVLELRDKLLKEHKDELDNPTVIADIMKQLTDYEREQLKDDADVRGFYINAKSYDVIRSKRFIMYGLEGGMGDAEPQLITKSLNEGWDVNNLPAMADGIRGGSYARGKGTAEGGEWVKHFYRVYQNIRIEQEDCGTSQGLPWVVTEHNHQRFVGNYQVVNGTSVLIKPEDTLGLVGKTIMVRSPMLCKAKAPHFCRKCCGEVIYANKDALHSVTARVGSIFMLVRMKQMHGKAIKTKYYDWQKAIT